MHPHVIAFHYTLKNTQGEVIDSSIGDEPMSFLQGSSQIIPGLEETLVEMIIGVKKQVKVVAERAYGPRLDQLVIVIERDQLPPGDVSVGDQFQGGDQRNPQILTVIAIEDGKVTLDGNHPLAGQDLDFEVEVVEKRPATQEEVHHGHAHGPGGHHHH